MVAINRSLPRPEILGISRRKGRVLVDMAHSANLYLSTAQGDAYAKMIRAGTYERHVASVLTRATSFLAPLLQSQLPRGTLSDVDLVDCGPATAETAVAQIVEVSRIARVVRYVPVDINRVLLDDVCRAVARRFSIAVHPLNLRFEDLIGNDLPNRPRAIRIVLFGGTGINYEVGELKRVLRKIAGAAAIVAVDGLLRGPGKDCITSYRSRTVEAFAFGPIRLMGGKPQDFAFQATWRDDRVSLEFVAQRTVMLAHEDCPVLKRGDSLRTAFSRRPTEQEYIQSIKAMLTSAHTVVMDQVLASSVGKLI